LYSKISQNGNQLQLAQFLLTQLLQEDELELLLSDSSLDVEENPNMDTCFFTFFELHKEQESDSSADWLKISSSNLLEQSTHLYSKIGMV